MPTNESFKGAIVRRLEATAQLLKLQQRLDEKLEQVGQARTELAQAERCRDRDADDLGLSAWVERLVELERAITDFRQGLELLQRDLDNCVQRRTAVDRYRQRRPAAEELAKEKASQAQQVDSNWSAKKTQLKTLEENVGADVSKILADIAVQVQREVEVGEQVERLLGAEALRPLVRKLDRRLAKDPEVRGRISLTNPSPATREAITALLGVPPKPTGAMHVNLELLDKVIRQSGAVDGLADAIAQLLDRQPQHPAIEGRKQKLAWREAYRDVAPSPSWSPAVDEFLQRICRNGALRRAIRWRTQG